MSQYTSIFWMRILLSFALWLGLISESPAHMTTHTHQAPRQRALGSARPAVPIALSFPSGLWKFISGQLKHVRGSRIRMIQLTFVCVVIGIFFLMWGKSK